MKRPALKAAHAALLIALAVCVPMARAGEGHDHGSEAPAAASQALPRFTAVSEAFELVGVLSGNGSPCPFMTARFASVDLILRRIPSSVIHDTRAECTSEHSSR